MPGMMRRLRSAVYWLSSHSCWRYCFAMNRPRGSPRRRLRRRVVPWIAYLSTPFNAAVRALLRWPRNASRCDFRTMLADLGTQYVVWSIVPCRGRKPAKSFSSGHLGESAVDLDAAFAPMVVGRN